MVKLISATESGEIITGLIQNRIKGGFMVLIDDVTAFLPGSLVDIRPVRETQYLEGTHLSSKLLKLINHQITLLYQEKLPYWVTLKKTEERCFLN